MTDVASLPPPSLRPELRRFLRSFAPGVRILEMPGDASTRRFLRILDLDGAPSRVVMDYGVPFEDETDDVRLTRVFEDAGLPVARILAVAPEAGALVLEDLGERTLETALGALRESSGSGSSAAARDLYVRAVELAAAIATRGTAALEHSPRAEGPALDSARFRFEMDFFVEHYIGHLMGRDASVPFRESLHGLAEDAASGPRVLCHRDYHCRNIMVRADGSLAMVDIQDARWGSNGYDIASLLRDAYVDEPDSWVDELVEVYLTAMPEGQRGAEFSRRLDLLSVQRMLKALGTFAYQAKIAGRSRYLSAVPRTLARLDRLIPRLPELEALDRSLRQIDLFDPALLLNRQQST